MKSLLFLISLTLFSFNAFATADSEYTANGFSLTASITSLLECM